MGMCPIPDLLPLSFARAEEPVLEPTLPVARLEDPSGQNQTPGESYSPSHQQSSAHTQEADPPRPAPTTSDPEPSPSDPGPPHQVNLFA